MVENFDQFIVDNSKTSKIKELANCYYTAIGGEDYVDDEGNTRQNNEQETTFAKSENGKYFIKVGLDNRAYNPIGMFSEGQYSKLLPKIGKKEFNFKRVNERVFSLYLSFLRTKNLAWLNNTNRELS